MTHAHHDHANDSHVPHGHDHHHAAVLPHVSLPHTHAVMPLTPLVMSATIRLSFVAGIVALIWALFFWATQ